MMKRVFSIKSQKPPLRKRLDSVAAASKGDYTNTDKFQKSERGGSLLCNFRYGAAAMQGFRPRMQDDFACSPSGTLKGESFGYFAVFDGHGRHGEMVSRYCSENFLNEFVNRKGLRVSKTLTADVLKSALTKTFVKFDAQLKEAARLHPSSGESEEDRVTFMFSGSTATVALVLGKHIVVANTGDSRTILCGSGGIRYSTLDHSPGNKIEDKRIEAAGGKVHTTPSKHKVILDPEAYTNLAVSRTLGDFGFKKSPTLPPEEQIVSPVPDIDIITREFGSDEFLLLASDGIFKSMSNAEAVSFVQERMQVTDDLAGICRDLIQMAYYSPEITPDDTTVVIVKFPAAPSVSSSAKQEDVTMGTKAMELIRMEVDSVVEGAEAKWVLDNEFNIIQRLVGKLPKKYNIQLKSDYITELIKAGRTRRFGSSAAKEAKVLNNPAGKVSEKVKDKKDEKESSTKETDVVVLHFSDNAASYSKGETNLMAEVVSGQSSATKDKAEETLTVNRNEAKEASLTTESGTAETISSTNKEAAVTLLGTSVSTPLLKKSGTISNPSPLMAELGKAMLKRKMSEPASSLKAKRDGQTENGEKNEGNISNESNNIQQNTNSKSDVNEITSEATSNICSPSTPIVSQSKTSNATVASDHSKKQESETECDIEIKPFTIPSPGENRNKKESITNMDITLTTSDPPADNPESSASETVETTTTVSISIEVNHDMDEAPERTVNEAVRRSQILSDFFDPDHDTCLEYDYDSDEKTTYL